MSLTTVYMSKAPGEWQNKPLPTIRDDSLGIAIQDETMRGLSYNRGLGKVFLENEAGVKANYVTDGYWEIELPKKNVESFTEGVSNQDSRLQITTNKPSAIRLAA